MNKLSVEDLDVKGRRVLVRVDFNVPLAHGCVADDARIRAALPTLKTLIANGGRLILMSHLGRPKGKRVPELSLKACVPALSALLEREVRFADDCVGVDAAAAASALENGEVLLLENLRYHQQETENDSGFARKLAELGEVYVNDAFGTAHRAHASTEGITHHIDRCAAGFLMIKEIEYLGKVIADPERPFVAILGGAKISGKIDVIANLLPKVDRVLVGGGMIFTFYKAQGLEIGNSLVETDRVEMAAELLRQGEGKIMLPVDCVVSDRFDFDKRQVGALETVPVEGIPPGAWGLDIGARSIANFRQVLTGAKTIVWNGPMGVFEIESTAKGTFALAAILAERTAGGATTVIGGGDSAAAVAKAGLREKVTHVSTGGGASLEFLEGKRLPGISALTDG